MPSVPLRKLILSAAIAAVLPLTAQAAPAQPNDFIEVLAKIFGEHKGIGKGHVKGV